MSNTTPSETLNIVYIHGVARQEETFADEFNTNVIEEYERLEINHSYRKIECLPFYWYPFVEERLNNYQSITTPSTWKRYLLFFGIIPLDMLFILYLIFFGFSTDPISNFGMNYDSVIITIFAICIILILRMIYEGLRQSRHIQWILLLKWIFLTTVAFIVLYLAFGRQSMDLFLMLSQVLLFIFR